MYVCILYIYYIALQLLEIFNFYYTRETRQIIL